MAESGRRVSNIKVSNSFKEGLILLYQGILEARRITHLHGSAHFTIPLSKYLTFFYVLIYVFL